MKKFKEKKLLKEIIFWIEQKRVEYIRNDKYVIRNFRHTKYTEILEYLNMLLKKKYEN